MSERLNIEWRDAVDKSILNFRPVFTMPSWEVEASPLLLRNTFADRRDVQELTHQCQLIPEASSSPHFHWLENPLTLTLPTQ